MTSRNVSHVKEDKFVSISHFNRTLQIGKYLGFPILIGRVKNVNFSYTGQDYLNVGGLENEIVGSNARSSRYLKERTMIHASSIHGASYIWNSMAKALYHIMLGFNYRIGKGNISLLWYDKWLHKMTSYANWCLMLISKILSIFNFVTFKTKASGILRHYLQHHQRNWISGFSGHCGISTSLKVELLAYAWRGTTTIDLLFMRPIRRWPWS